MIAPVITRTVDAFAAEVRQTLVPDLSSQSGPLPPLLVVLTLVTGLVDAFSYLVLGRVFVANMTGNVVFLGFALGGAPDFSILDSLLGLLAFVAGALVGGRLGALLGEHRGRQLSSAASLQALLLAVAVVLTVLNAPVTTTGLSSSWLWPWASRTPPPANSVSPT